VAILVMLGWVMRVPWMVQIIPGTVAMVFSNALCMFLLGTALILTTVRQRWCKPVQTMIGIGVLLVGVTVMLQYRFGLALPLDLAGMHIWLNNNPGRMAPNTALAHALAGLTVLLATHARPGVRAVPALIGAFAVAMAGIAGLVGYRLQPELLYGWDIQTRMALHTGTAFVLLGIGYAVAVYRTRQLGELFRQREDLRVGLLGGALMVFVGLAGGLLAFTLLQEQMDSVLRNGLKVSFNNREDHIASQIPALIRTTRDFANRPGIQRELTRLRAAPGDRAALQYIQLALRRHVVTGPVSGRLYDTRGRFLASAGPADDTLLELPLQQAVSATLLWNGQSVKLRAAHPIVANGVPLGRVELVYALPVLTHMVQGAQESNQSGEMQLCARSGPVVRCLPMRLAPQRTGLPATGHAGPTPIARALASESGVALDTDYRGERVIAVYGPVGNLGLGMVLKVDVDEIYAPVRQRFEVMLLVIGLIIASGIVLLRSRLVPLVRRLALSEQRYRSLLEAAPDAMLVTDPDGRIVWVNSQAERLFGYAREELTGQPVEMLVPEGRREIHTSKRNGYARSPVFRDMGKALELYGRRKDGSVFPAEIGLSPQDTGDGPRVISAVRDISERQRAMQELRDSEQRWQFALEGARDGVWDWNLVTNEVYFSPQWKRMLGFEEHEIAGSLEEWDKRVHPDDKARAYADIEKHLKGEAPYYQNEHRVLCKDGSYKWILDRGMIVDRGPDGKPTRMIGTHTDMTERRQAEETIRELSLVDDLTGLRNRRGFLVLGELQLSLAQRLGRTVMLYFADVDGLKQINDTLGHEEGDRALTDIAEILRATFRETDIIARLGGDEFVVLALEAQDVDTATSVARFEEHVSQYNRSARRPYRLAASMGVAQREPGSGESLAELLHRADTEMYRIKQRRRAG
jgi:diguanylate cyclase (GGDEF)-like protein/PAS domain S-box-containing protein